MASVRNSGCRADNVPGRSYDADRARLEIRFSYPAVIDHEYYRINWVEPERNFMLGFYQDADHPDVDPCHTQLNHEDTPIDRHGATFLEAHPPSMLDKRLQQLPLAVDSIQWGGRTLSLPLWPVR